MSLENYKTITLEDMMNYIDEYAPEYKQEFKEAAIIELKTGEKRYNYMRAKRAFCQKFMPQLLPQSSHKPTKTEIIMNW